MTMTALHHQVLALETAQGTMRTHLFTPDGGAAAGLIMFMDVFGLREELFGLARTYAAEGFAVYLPNLFYREGDVSFPTPKSAEDTTHPDGLRLNASTTIAMSAQDIGAIFTHAPAGMRFATIGYCMGGRHAIKVLHAWPDRVCCAVSVHGGRLVTSAPDSPHLLIQGLRGPAYFGFAANDHACPDAHQALIRAEIAKAPVAHEAETFQAAHGWSFPTRHCHDGAVASHVFQHSLSLFRTHCGAPHA